MDASVVKNARARQPLKAAKAVRKAAQDRGKANGNISFIYGEKVRKELVVTSDIELANLLDLEADQTVVRYDIDPERIIADIGGELFSTKPDAVVHYRDFRREIREVKYSDEIGTDARAIAQQKVLEARREKAGISWRFFTDEDAFAKRLVLLNWLDVEAVLREARAVPTVELEKRVAAAVYDAGKTSLAGIHDALHLEWRLVFAAIFRAHQKGTITVNLSRKLSWATAVTPCDLA
ncbi:hypothetical protein [Ramlibacter sp. WS9]|uniref:hypothetical protein n=1 Tax=Ramlibacter sp. WS9 TaxID=1882741 RepID=UPI00114170C7|nr:hypothetical protein [Ramlibacter sp. WS9]ROZ78140.1 hypothetical protein EEB15_06745 [Ramlibacter sp. WS9]